MKHFSVLIAVMVWFSIMPRQILAQEINDTSSRWMIETTDGNEFTGSLISEDSTAILILTADYGRVRIPQRLVKLRREIKPSSIKEGEFWFTNPHATRYFYGPNGYGLKKGEAYYQNTWILFNQLSYGITDYLSMGVGLMPLFLFAGSVSPAWVTPKLSIPVIKNKFNIGGGIMFAHILGEGISFGISYGTFTVGDRDSNLSLGMGWAFADGEWARSPTFMLSGMSRAGRKTYLLTENYYFDFGEGFSFGIISAGARSVQKRLAIDYGLFMPLGSDIGEIIAVPWLGITIPFGKIQQQ